MTVYGKGNYNGAVVRRFRIYPVVKNENITLKAGKTKKIKVKASGKCKYKSLNKKIAKVSKKGVVTGNKKGKVKIKVTCNGQSSYCYVKVKKAKKKKVKKITYVAPRKPTVIPQRVKKKKFVPKS